MHQKSLKALFHTPFQLFLEPEWAIDSEAMRARGIIVLVKSNYMVKKISRLNNFHKLKLDMNPFLPPKHYKYGGRFSLLVGYDI